jgi:hypothetical protein
VPSSVTPAVLGIARLHPVTSRHCVFIARLCSVGLISKSHNPFCQIPQPKKNPPKKPSPGASMSSAFTGLSHVPISLDMPSMVYPHLTTRHYATPNPKLPRCALSPSRYMPLFPRPSLLLLSLPSAFDLLALFPPCLSRRITTAPTLLTSTPRHN